MMPYPVIDVKATGENILRRRIERGYTVLDMQRYLNLACPQSVYHWQAGRTLPNIDNFYALSVLLGTTVWLNEIACKTNRHCCSICKNDSRFRMKPPCYVRNIRLYG